MFRRPEIETLDSSTSAAKGTIVVAGPGSALTIPGIIATEIALSLAQAAPVVQIEIDREGDLRAGLHRAPSLAAAHGASREMGIVRHAAPANARDRAASFKEWIAPTTAVAVASVWPGIDNTWVRPFLQAARAVGATAVVACASPPSSAKHRATSLADAMALADLVLVGDMGDAAAVAAKLGPSGPPVESHRALWLGGRRARPDHHQITAFLPRDDQVTLSTLLVAFDAIPEAWIQGYHLQVVMRHGGGDVPGMVASSYHADYVRLIGEDLSAIEIEALCASSSALSVAEPGFDSRAFGAAVETGVATVVLSTELLPLVGRGYVGGLLADLNRPASVHVGLTHALRLQELGFPSPGAWDELARRLGGAPRRDPAMRRVLEPATHTA